ncbi:acyltransferase family protein [Micromonospora chaiyaphumensis]|uniref:Peptidoglycan/LPS O-acetylase OafA/YrhL, contains acyltransferase and SGNH-hydrolase domains n=1 Tax=Micromonospora chaiyaphumensis TaxID=307119 RepID=A0A1C4VP66_9ACTN|nr:acyltransferase family protein [Micromonospora chaiyaphumensis]SCE85802.1 Peptidoglycan/LPS O-acetylase OafA/YrhL, contains acyltransferase and SGNH-hydrolase domains [Micromonospora chaiyaphumensis]
MTSPELTTVAAPGSSQIEKPPPAGPSTLPDQAAGREPRRESTPSRFRADVAGLRAVAVGLVLLYHAGLPFLPGGFVGVDVFFVISGFLITGQLINEIDRTGRISLLGFYARRAKRILPAATVVLAATAVAVRLFVPRGQWQEIGGDIAAAAIYVVNWRFADRAVDYLAADNATTSPVQHFWSLAVEEQFYLLWPLLIILAILAAKRLRRTNVRPVLWIGLAVLAVPSFAWSIIETATSPERAFFVSTTRLWELAVGAGIALAATGAARMPRALAVVLGWLGLAAIVAAALLVTKKTAWPGYAAALPTLGAAAVIAAGAAAGSRGPVLVLGTRPFRWVGDLSYSLYLWHWPMLIVAGAYWDGLSVKRGLVVALASVVPAWITFRLVENPLRYSRAVSKSPRLALSLGGNFTMAGICAGLALVLTAAWAANAQPTRQHYAPGAALLSTTPGTAPIGPVPERFDVITPDPLQIRQGFMDVPVTNRDKCFQQVVGSELLWCTYGNPTGSTTVALVGDSKMDQWLPAFQVLAAQNDWKLVIAAKASCPFTSAPALRADDPTKLYTDCIDWNKALLRRLTEERPDYVVTSQGASRALDTKSGKGTVEAMIAGVRASWKALDSVGSKVVVLANNPGPGPAVTCADKNRNHLSACAFDRKRHDQDAAYVMQRKAVAGVPEVKMIDLFDAICPTDKCPVVFGNVLIYRGGSHIGAAYVKTTAPHLARALSDIGVPARFAPSN